jgi:hypothetical protein
MPNVLTTASDVTCGHRQLPALPGAVQVASAAKLKVNSNPVLLESSVSGKTISGCGIPIPPQGNLKCTTVLSVANKAPPKLKVNGDAVLVGTITGTTTGTVVDDPDGATPQKKLAATANQSKLLTA